MPKLFLTYEQQLNKLSSEKGLAIPNLAYAKQCLQDLSYYALINGYKDLFKHGPSGNFLHNVTFEEIVTFYYFDESLRTLFFKYILHIEKRIKSLLSYHFCEKYGEQQSEYLNIKNYNLSSKNKVQIQRLVNTLQNTISLPSHYPYISHYITHHNNVPLWVIMKALTLGNVSAMYQYCTSDVRTKISKDYRSLSENQLHQCIRLLANCRNICAHGERLYCFYSREAGPDMPLHQKLGIQKKNNEYVQGKHDLFAVVIALRYLTRNEEFKEFKRALQKVLKAVQKSCPHLSYTQLLLQMGFPEAWNKILRFKT